MDLSQSIVSQSKKYDKGHESIQSSTTPEQECHMEKWQITIRHHKQMPREQPFSSRWPLDSNEHKWKHDKHKT